MSTTHKRFVSFSYRDFRLYWFAQLLSLMGTQMQIVAVAWHIYLLTNSAVALGLIGLAGTIPIILLSPISGIFADRHDRKKTILTTQAFLLLFASVLSFVTYTGLVTPVIIYLIVIIAAVANTFNMPAYAAFIPKLVDREHLTDALSMNYIMRQIAMVLGPAVAGFLIASHGVGAIYALNALSYVAIMGALILIKTDGSVVGERSTFSFHSVNEGIHFIKSKTIIWSTMLLDFFSTFFSSATSLLPIFARDILKVGPQGLGFLYAAPAIGAIVAGLFISHGERWKSQGKIILSAVILYAIGTILFGLSKSFTLSLFALGLVGAGDSISTILRNVIRQLETPDNIRGRMTSINMIFFMGGPQLGEFEAGLLAALIGGPATVVVGGVATILCVGLVALFIPKLREYQAEPAKEVAV